MSRPESVRENLLLLRRESHVIKRRPSLQRLRLLLLRGLDLRLGRLLLRHWLWLFLLLGLLDHPALLGGLQFFGAPAVVLQFFPGREDRRFWGRRNIRNLYNRLFRRNFGHSRVSYRALPVERFRQQKRAVHLRRDE